MRPIRRPHRRRRLSRPGPSPQNANQEIPEGIPIDPEDPDASTFLEGTAVAEPVQDPMKGTVSPSAKTAVLGNLPRAQDETAELLAIREQPGDSKAESAGALDGELEPAPPEKLAFACPCGATLEASKKTYDTRITCGTCRALLLISLVWDPEKRRHEIEPFRVGDVPDLP
jgi:hypothetical protein